jgi:hypothetical protein
MVLERLNLRCNSQAARKNTNLVENVKEINYRFHTLNVNLKKKIAVVE